jgi:hypothetical protein
VTGLFARNLDLVLLALALPIFLAAGFPMVGYAGGATAYLLQRLVGELLARRAERADDYKTKLGLLGGSMVGRGWLAALIIFGTYLVDDEEAGLAAAVLFLMVFTVGFTTMILTRAGERLDEAAGRSDRRRPR